MPNTSAFKALLIVTVVSVLAVASRAAAGSLEDGLAAFKRADYATAAKLIREAADRGDGSAQFDLAIMYVNGVGVGQDDAAAAAWLRKAAEQGHALASVHLGILYADGKGVPQSYVEAAAWTRKAAERGNGAAQALLGTDYIEGRGVDQDYAQAVEWLRKAAEQGDNTGQQNLGVAYALGKGVPQDNVRAYMWLDLASRVTPAALAEQLTGPELLLAGAADAGSVVATAKGFAEEGRRFRDIVAKSMSSEQLAEAQKLAREWKPRAK